MPLKISSRYRFVDIYKAPFSKNRQTCLNDILQVWHGMSPTISLDRHFPDLLQVSANRNGCLSRDGRDTTRESSFYIRWPSAIFDGPAISPNRLLVTSRRIVTNFLIGYAKYNLKLKCTLYSLLQLHDVTIRNYTIQLFIKLH